MEIYKIKNNEELYFSQLNKNIYSLRNKTGKSWNRIEDILFIIDQWKLNPQCNKEVLEFIKTCEIVKFELKEIETIEIE